MSDSPSTFSTVGAAARDAVNDHPTLRFAHLTAERVVNADAAERLELHTLCLDAGATRCAADLERWTPDEQLEQLRSSELVHLRETARTSELAARCVAELERRRAQLRAAESLESVHELALPALRALLAVGADVTVSPIDTGREHAPIAERVRVVARPELGFIELRGWLVGSRPDVSGRVGALSLVKLPGQSQPLVIGTHETRLGWER